MIAPQLLFSRERTRLACKFRRLAEMLLLFNQEVVGEAPTTAREARALPRSYLLRPDERLRNRCQ